MADNSTNNGWKEYKVYLMNKVRELDELRRAFEDHRTEQNGRISRLETKAGLLGAVGGAVLGLIVSLLVQYVNN